MDTVTTPYNGPAELLRPLIERWAREANGAAFGLSIDVDRVLLDLQAMIDGQASDVLILVVDGVIAGLMGLHAFESPTGPQMIANEHYWYVAQEKRGRGSLEMIDAAKAWARAKGCTHMLFNASRLASDLHDDVCRVYEHKGMKPFETTFIARID